MAFALHSSVTPGAKVNFSESGMGTFWLPPGPPRQYRLSQADDYHQLPRARFPWLPPISFSVRARASHAVIPGTWGFGLWNDPMSLSLGFGSARKLPALPNAVWYFFASPQNFLSLCDDLPSNGALAATFRSPNLPTWLLASGGLALPLLFFRPLARRLRRLAAKVVQQDAVALPLDPTKWHTYAFTWTPTRVTFEVDGAQALETSISPRGPLGLVLWVDNQFAAWRPDGALQWGVLEGQTAYEIQIEDLHIK